MSVELFDVFNTYFVDHPDFNESDQRQETQRLLDRNGAIDDFLHGDIQEDELLDRLQEHTGVGADQFIEVVNDNVDHIIRNNIEVVIEGFSVSGGGLLLPSYLI
jgi:hypothetical protein